MTKWYIFKRKGYNIEINDVIFDKIYRFRQEADKRKMCR